MQCHDAAAATAKQTVEGGVTELISSSGTNTFSLNEKQVSLLNLGVFSPAADSEGAETFLHRSS